VTTTGTGKAFTSTSGALTTTCHKPTRKSPNLVPILTLAKLCFLTVVIIVQEQAAGKGSEVKHQKTFQACNHTCRARPSTVGTEPTQKRKACS
jgi:hypothetical protein